MSKTYRTDYIKQGCIGCRACAKILPEFWEMEEEKPSVAFPRAFLKDSKQTISSNGIVIKETRVFKEKDKEAQIIAISICPVNVIKVYDEETGEELKKL